MNRHATLPQPDERHRGGSPNDGSIVALTAIMLVPLVIGLAIVVDSGRVWAERAALQNAVEVTAASAASTWIRTNSVCPSSVLVYLTQDDATPTSHSCTTTGNSRAGTITVTAGDASPLFFSSLLGRSSAGINASTTAEIGSVGSLLGVWPVALCEKHPSIVAWRNSGFSSVASYTITLQTGPQNCGSGVSGNWGVLDFNGGANSTSETINWVQNGYAEPLDVGDVVLGSPGGLTSSIGINSMIGKTILIPLFDLATASGSNANYRISGFARAVLLGTQLSGAAASRSLTVRFETAIVDRPTGSVGGGSNFGITSWAICAYDNKGDC
jgi:uncharacterized membrane protein